MTNKFLDLAGLQILVDKIKSTITSAVSAAEIISGEYDKAGKISLAKGDTNKPKVDISLPLASSLTGTQSGLLTKAEYDALVNKVEYVATKVTVDGKTEYLVSAPLENLEGYNNVAAIELLSAVDATNNSKSITSKAVADYVSTQIEANAKSDKEYVDNTVSGAVDTLTKAYTQADNTLSESLTEAYTNAILLNAQEITKNYEAADAIITASYTQLVGETKEALETKIGTDISTAINNLDVEDSAIAGQYVSAVSEADGKISVTRAKLPVYSLKKTDTAGYKYELTVDDVATGDAINIKDMVVSDGSVSTHADGKTYLDLTIANGDTVSIPADALVDTYTAGDDIITVGDYTISLNLAKLTEDLVVDTTMLGTFATVSSVQKVASDLSTLDSKVTEHLTEANNTYATKDDAIGSLSELDFVGDIKTDSYYASFSAKDVNGTTHSTITFNLATKTEIESLF